MESTKRAKPPNSGSNIPQVPNCLVDGCEADLSLCREYHRRHKVCEAHSKTPIVTISGRQQRFCQQCSRFHSLVEFDEEKRSCRKRLDGHNRRRRKPQPESLVQNAGGLLYMNHPSRVLSFGGSSQIMPPPTWPGENSMAMCCNQYQYNERRESSFLKFPFHQPSSICSTSSHDRNSFPDGQNHHGLDANGALSLLSTSTQATEGFTSLSNNKAERTQAAIAHHAFNYDPFPQHRNSAAASSSSHNHGGSGSGATLHFPEMFQHGGGEGSSSDAAGGSHAHQTHSFMWE